MKILADQEFWFVTKPSSISTIRDICGKTNLFHLAQMVRGGLEPKSIVALFSDEAEAKSTAAKLLKDRGPRTSKSKQMVHRAWTVYQETEGRREEIDIVFFDYDCKADYVKQSLVDHDGYNSSIEIKGAGLVICSHCEETINENAQICPECKTELGQDDTRPHVFK